MMHASFSRAGRAEFLEGMARMAHTVSIVTTDGPEGRDGMTVTAATPVSADDERPSLLVCLRETSRPTRLMRGNGVFCLNVLAEDHAGLSDCFSGRRGGMNGDWFAAARWSRLASDAPALDGALANFDCDITQVQRMGTHLVIFGAVLAVRTAEGRPLLHANRGYGRLG